MVAATGKRYKVANTDTTKAFRHLPLLSCEELRDVIPYHCVPVAVDLVEGAHDLCGYTHPESAFYIFGPEDGTLGEKTLSWCRDKISVSTRYCMNLAATVHVVLYDRMSKQSK